MTEPEGGKGPFSILPFIEKWGAWAEAAGMSLKMADELGAMVNHAYAAGRASRDNLRKALESAGCAAQEQGPECFNSSRFPCERCKAIADDDKAGK